jgi:hypothetical protein
MAWCKPAPPQPGLALRPGFRVFEVIYMSIAATDAERKIEIRGIKYQMIFQDGEPVLKRYDKKHKMWVTLCFAKDGGNDHQIINEVSYMLVEMFTK